MTNSCSRNKPMHVEEKDRISRPRGRKRAGFVLVLTALALCVLMGAAGLAVDVGRMYIAKHELQTYADSTALAGTVELDGTAEGIYRAKSVLITDGNRWNLHTTPVSDATMSFAKDAAGPWETVIYDPRGYRYARVIARGGLRTYFLPTSKSAGPPLGMILATNPLLDIRADSGAGQVPKTTFREGLFPFSPYAHGSTGPHFGLVVGDKYTLRWASSPRLNQNVCPGDNTTTMLSLAGAGGGDERGFIESTSADLIRQTIEQDYQTVNRTIGEPVTMTGGIKQTQLTSLLARIRQDVDQTSATFADYSSTGVGNGRRVVAVPINTGYPEYKIVQIGAFLLLPASEYANGGNKPFCAEYVGAWVQGSTRKGAAESGAYVATLIR
jgi:hypothetical protein